MKKIMMMAVVACAAFGLRAATVDWNVSIGLLDSNWGPAQGTMLFAAGEDTWSMTFDDTGSINGTISGDSAEVFAEGTKWSATMTTELFDAEGNSIKLETYKDGKVDMSLPKGDVMTAEEFFIYILKM